MWRTDVTVNPETIENQIDAIYNLADTSKSTKMKQLFDLGLDIKEIAQIMGTRYNFVYNVVSNYVNVESIPVSHTQAESKKQLIIDLFVAGKSNKEIAKELKLNYNYIYKVVREYGEQQSNSFRQTASIGQTQQPAPQQPVQQPTQQIVQIPVASNLPELIAAVMPELDEQPEQPEPQQQVAAANGSRTDWRAAVAAPRYRGNR